MRINPGRVAGQPTDRRGPTFTGEVWAEPLLAETHGVGVNSVFFPPGARTHWHTHERGQLLVVTSGRGHLANDRGDRGELRAGDVAWIDPGERHWHGAAADTTMTHVAVSLGAPDWQDAVSDDDYAEA